MTEAPTEQLFRVTPRDKVCELINSLMELTLQEISIKGKIGRYGKNEQGER